MANPLPMDDIAIAICVKTPGLTPVKTRLAATIGTAKAERFYHWAVHRIQETVQQTPYAPYWAIGEPEGINHPLWQAFPTLPTGILPLGDMLHKLYHSLLQQHRAALLIGADSPQMTPNHLLQAGQVLQSNPYVVGPAEDGGFWLVGGRQPIPEHVWLDIPYSTHTTCNELTHCLAHYGKISTLPTLSDVDIEADLVKAGYVPTG